MHLTETSRHSIKIKYWFNTATDNVQKFTVVNGAAGTFGAYNMGGAGDPYAAGTLTKTVTVNEDQKQVIEFKDTDGRGSIKKKYRIPLLQMMVRAKIILAGCVHIISMMTRKSALCIAARRYYVVFKYRGEIWARMHWRVNNVSGMNMIVKTG